MFIDKEELVYEAGKFYPVLHVIRGCPDREEEWMRGRADVAGRLGEKLADEERVRSVLDRYGECLVCEGHPVLVRMLERDLEREAEILQRLRENAGKNAAGEDAGCGESRSGNGQRMEEVEQKIEEVRGLMEAMKRG